MIAVLVVVGLAGVILLFMETGRRLRVARLAAEPEAADAELVGVEAAVFGLMGLLIAFTFSGAATRFDMRRLQTVDEVNAVGTAWLRLDLLPAADQPVVRALFRDYVDARIAAYRVVLDNAAWQAELARAAGLQQQIWSRAVAGVQASSNTAPAVVLLPALNEMFDMASSRALVREIHIPTVVLGLLAAVTLVCALLAGYASGAKRGRRWFHTATFVVALAVALYVIVDFEYPRAGVVRLDHLDHALVDLRATMGP